MLPQVEGDPANDFGTDWIEAWSKSENYRIWDRYTDSHLFDIVEPKHPCAGGLTIDDVQRRMMEQVKEYHLDERFAVGKEVLGRNLQAGREKASTVFNKLYADMEALREAQRRKNEEQKREGGTTSPKQDVNGAKQTVQSVGSKAGAYLGSWGTWVGEKRKTGWGRSTSGNQTQQVVHKKDNTLPLRNEKEVVRQSFEGAIFDAELHAKHVGDGQITKVEIPLGSPPLSDDGRKRASRFHEAIDDESPIAPTANSAVENSKTSSEAAPAKRASILPTGAHQDSNNIAKKEDQTPEVIKRKSVAEAVEAATATPISP